jgi:5-formyltetrahydrofolate cyclo-ligase
MPPAYDGAVTVEETSTAKTALRRRLRATRRERLADRDVEAEASALADHVTALVEDHTQGRVCRVAAYESRPTEPPTHLMVDRLAAAGYEIVVPITLADLDLDWRVAGSGDALGLNAIHDAVVVVAPAVAADLGGGRLGQGGGSYDRALARRDPHALVVVLLHDGELLPAGDVPVDAHDVPVDVAVTPSGGVVRLGSG